VQLNLNADDLEPLIERVFERVIARLETEREALGDRIAFSEAEAAALLGLEAHQLRDERRRGRIKASRIVNRAIRYLRSDIMDYLHQHRSNGVD
jgi:hypothetical protein